MSSHPSGVTLHTVMGEPAWSPAGGRRVEVLFGPIQFELLLGGPYGYVSKTRQTEIFLVCETKR